ncbi:MAG: type IV pili twitching motility protein PilT, partial [Elusimicrobia bacterium CG11_big_fil_rev_8_21_14_0_20_64_6]
MAELTEVLTQTARLGASDLHLVIGKPPMVRRQGIIEPLPGLPEIRAEECERMIY